MAPTWVQAGIKLNGAENYAFTASFYAPTSAGTANYILKANGLDEEEHPLAPTWTAAGIKLNGAAEYSFTASFYAPTSVGSANQILISRGVDEQDNPLSPIWATGGIKLNGAENYALTASFYAPIGSGTTGQILQSNGTGTAPTWTNTSNITTLGTITTGAWHGSTVGVDYGGTGKTTWTQWGVVYASASTTLTNTGAGAAGQFLKSNGTSAPSWADSTIKVATTTSTYYLLGYTSTSGSPSTIYCQSSVYVNSSGYLYANRVYNAVWNDYAEYRQTNDIDYGRVYQENNNGIMTKTQARLIPGCSIASDTFGSAMGQTEKAKTAMAVSGRVLVYTYKAREDYQAGMAVCSAPDGTVDIMTREEIMMYPDCIIGYVSEIPDYEEWGTGHIKINGRIWIKI